MIFITGRSFWTGQGTANPYTRRTLPKSPVQIASLRALKRAHHASVTFWNFFSSVSLFGTFSACIFPSGARICFYGASGLIDFKDFPRIILGMMSGVKSGRGEAIGFRTFWAARIDPIYLFFGMSIETLHDNLHFMCDFMHF
jgi:hypothetical protein